MDKISNETRAAVLNEALDKLRQKKDRVEQTYNIGNVRGIEMSIAILEEMLVDRERSGSG